MSEESQAQLCEWLLSGIPYHRVKAMIQEQFHIATSLGALSNFWDSSCSSMLIARRQQAVSTADTIADDAKKKPGNFDAATLDAIKQKAFELSISPQADPNNVKALFGLILKARDQDLQNRDIEIKIRRLELVEQQLRETRERLVKDAGGSVDPKVLADEIDRILGRKS
ncbi:MAG: hypothetical protein HY343_09650 [Lentisphaerae bacterium]|nr:hypothetical protein [Lentisphaerota bacterium]